MTLDRAARPRTILFVDHATAMGGAENSLLMLMCHLDPARWRPVLACPEGQLADAARDHNVAVHIVPLLPLRWTRRSFLNGWTGARDVARLAIQVAAHAIYSNTVRSAIYATIAARFARRPFIWHMRDFWLTERSPRCQTMDRLIKQRLLASSRFTIVNSEAVANHLPSSRKIHIVHNGIELKRFSDSPELTQSARNAFRKQYDVSTDSVVIGMVARLRPWKGPETFLRMAASVVAKCPSVCFLVVGGTPFAVNDEYPAFLRQLAVELDLYDSVRFTGHIEQVKAALGAMDIFVHPGEPEPFGLVNIEAMAMCKPTVAFAHGALPEIVQDGLTGRLVPPNDVEAMADAVVRLAVDPTRRRTMGRAASQRVAAHFSIERTAQQISTLLEAI